MFQYLVRRILWALLLFLVITFVTFVIFFIAPTDPARAVCGGETAQRACLVLGAREAEARQAGRGAVRLLPRTGSSSTIRSAPRTRRAQSINQTIAKAAPVTATLVFGGAVLWMMIGLSVGILSALRPRSLLDRSAMVFVLIGVSAHPVWIGLIFSYFFGVKWHITPIANYANFFGAPADSGLPGGPWQWFYHMILPWWTFALLFAALYVRMIRANVMETMNEDFVRTARAKGAPEQRVLISHVLRNALLPVVTMLGMDIGVALGGAIFTETRLPATGLRKDGHHRASRRRTSPPSRVWSSSRRSRSSFFNLIVDILYAWIDPRIRLT